MPHTALSFSNIAKLNKADTSVSLIERWQNDTNPFKILDGSEEIEKFNPYHDRLGRFTTGGGASSFTWRPGASAAHDSAIAREKERASSGTSAGDSKADTKTSERGHIKPKSYEENIETVKQELGCDDKQAKKYMRSMLSYTAENYEAIRAYQSGKKNDYTKKFRNDAKNIEEYIDKAPHWNGGTLYRGVGLDASVDVKSAFKPGTELNMQGTSSWSSDTGIAKNFARDRNMVIFQCDRISKATSVSHISNNPGEKEVLVSKDTKYVAKKVSKRGRYYYVYLDEVTATSKSYSGADAKSFSEVLKFNPYHDRLGRFTSGGSATSFTYRPGASKAHDNAIAREKKRTAAMEAAKHPKKKRTLSDYYKERKQKDMDFFYGKGNTKKLSNKYFEFKRVLDDDNCIVVTNNIKTIKGNPVMITGNNQAVYLKDWQYRPVHNYYDGIDAYAVKLNRKYYRPYTFRFNFDDYSFDKNNSFDDMMDTARQQEQVNMKFAEGHMG